MWGKRWKGQGMDLDLVESDVDIRSLDEPPSRQLIIDRLRVRLLNSFDGDRDPGTLPGERQIAESLGDVSRVPVHEALVVLRALGVVWVDRDRKRYVATTDALDLDDAAPAGSEPVLQRELQAHFRNVLDFYEEAASLAYRPGYQLQDAVRALGIGVETRSGDHAADIIALNNALAGLAAALGLGRSADLIQSQLDVMELSVAAARRARRDAREPCLVLDPGTIAKRRQSVRTILSYVESVLAGEDRLDAAYRAFRAYLDMVVGQASPLCLQQLPIAC